jgi:hypothetical protein
MDHGYPFSAPPHNACITKNTGSQISFSLPAAWEKAVYGVLTE